MQMWGVDEVPFERLSSQRVAALACARVGACVCLASPQAEVAILARGASRVAANNHGVVVVIDGT